MTSFETLTVNIDARGVAYVGLNRADKRNALSPQMLIDLSDMAMTLGRSDDIRAIVLSGEGSVFCAGGDLNWMREQIMGDRTTRMREARKLAMMLNTLNEMPKPLIGRVHGGAFGGGIGMCCVCDVAIALEGTKFGLTETKLGITPATISPYVMARIGEGHARRIFMSSRIFDAPEAKALGIVADVASADQIDAAIEAQVAPYLVVAPKAVGEAKALARLLGPRIDAAMIDETISRLADIWEGDEAREGIEAFLNKRPAPWA